MFIQLTDIFKASILSGLLVLAFLYYLQSQPYSRKLLVLFIIMLFGGLVFSHLFTMATLRVLRIKGYNLRHYVVIGAGKKGQQLVRDIEQTGWFGLKCSFFVDNSPARIGTELLGVPVYGPVEKLNELVKAQEVDEVYLALSGTEAQAVYPLLERLQWVGTTIRIIPDWGNLTSISGATAVTIGSQVLFSAADSPLSGVNIILKELFDRTASLTLLTIFAIPIAIIAVLIKLTSKGPVFFKQARVGMDQKKFEMLKFRTMTTDAEKENGPQWAGRDDPRCTPIGAWLRRMSLDEIPQLINVLKGEMSLTGPRPERPHFVKQFSEEYKKYMFRHKLKAGMTGWAQIHGFRGDTSLKKRLQYDLYYIRNWSLWLDLWILLRTPLHIIKGENAH
jgi:exopolysaccharide biosynthesis polyprenyl glycosylphosphotransferase